MSDTKFTQGPWLVGEDQCVDETWSIVTTSGGSIIANVNDRHDRKANAHLISAAPDLYAALEEVAGSMHQIARDRDMSESELAFMRRIDAALAKARGKA